MITREEAKEIAKNAVIEDLEVIAEIAEIESAIRAAAAEGRLHVHIPNKGTSAFGKAKTAIYVAGGISFEGISGDSVHLAKWN